MRLTYIGNHDAILVGPVEAVRDGDSFDHEDAGLSKEQAEGLVARGDFKTGNKKPKPEEAEIPAEDFEQDPVFPAPNTTPANAPEKE